MGTKTVIGLAAAGVLIAIGLFALPTDREGERDSASSDSGAVVSEVETESASGSGVLTRVDRHESKGPGRRNANASDPLTENEGASRARGHERTAAPAAVIRGTVEDESGRAVTGAAVGFIGRWMLSDENGAFELAGIPAVKGQHVLVLHPKSGFGSVSLSSVRVGDEHDIVVRLVAPRLVEVRGRVVDPDGELVSGARVSVQLIEHSAQSTGPTIGRVLKFRPQGDSGAARVFEDYWATFAAPAAAEGRFRFSLDAAALTFTLTATADGYQTSVSRFIHLGDRPWLEQDITLPPVQRYAGRVVELGTDTPVEGAQIYFEGPGHRRRGVDPAATTAADGSFAIEQTRVAQTTLFASADGFVNARWPIQAVAEETPLELPRMAELAVEVTLDDGSALAGARVSATPKGLRRRFAQPRYRMPSGTTDADGHLRLQAWPGEWTVSVRGPDGRGVSVIPEERVLTLPRTDPYRVRLNKGLSIAGRIVDAAGNGVAYAHLDVKPSAPLPNQRSGRVNATSTKDGRFEVVGLVSGAYDIHVSFPSRDAKVRHLPIRREGVPAGTAELVLTADPGEALSGIVVDGKGRPVADAEVVAVKPNGARAQYLSGPSTRTDANGAFVLTGLAAGTYRLKLHGRPPDRWLSYLEGGENVRAPAADLRLVRSYGPSISGSLVDDSGKALVGASVDATLDGPRGRWDGQVITDERGRFVLRGLAPNARYTLICSKTGFQSKTVSDVAVGSVDLRVRVNPD